LTIDYQAHKPMLIESQVDFGLNVASADQQRVIQLNVPTTERSSTNLVDALAPPFVGPLPQNSLRNSVSFDDGPPDDDP
jgi:hypothetical protein